MWSDGKTLWVSTTRGAAAAYDLQTLEHLPGLSLSTACGYVVGLWSDGHQVSLTPGTDTTLTITVTAPNGVDTETYTIEITESD
ncbi:cadherin-like beta sandwich domain-containing protein [Candidatus Poriferisodalis sp.]|uniref:cadherin-like beta sandwich domain-containing protein n=1 Tax=Candidatus Poriferisodalis sp. TaxID=3101277 RepID=UPI003B02308B